MINSKELYFISLLEVKYSSFFIDNINSNILICYKIYITILPSFRKEILEKGGYIQMIKFTVRVLITALLILFVF